MNITVTEDLIIKQPKRVARLFARILYNTGIKQEEYEDIDITAENYLTVEKVWKYINNYINSMEETYPKFNGKKFRKMVIDFRDELAQLSLFPKEINELENGL